MSAEWFETSVSKRDASTPSEAFNLAVERALYDYGHAGYTGTIAEKDSFIILKDNVIDDRGVSFYEDKRIADKWGPAGCYQTKDDWVFVGWASS